ncbi:MAG: hypothetical protein HQ596_07880 [Candidatus Saganbacteria bacterium]|nr:hypothetical protein [Candidatus Saganbacteria bacterium]
MSESAHLLGMSNACRKSGHPTAIRNGVPADRVLLRYIRKLAPGQIAMSFIGGHPENIGAAHTILKSLPEPRPMLFVGGPDVRRHDGYYVDELAPYYQDRFGGLVLTTGEGERLLSGFASNDFDVDGSFFKVGAGAMISEKAIIFGDLPHVPLDEHGFLRPYTDLSPYGSEAQVKWAMGCWANCGYCPNPPDGVADYRSPESAEKEVVYLDGLGVHRISVTAPNFLANIHKGSAIIDRVPKAGKLYSLTVRPDSLLWTVEKYPDIWQEFGRGWNIMGVGPETTLAARADRMGKYRTPAQAEIITAKLEKPLSFFEDIPGLHTSLLWFLIPFDWRMNLTELEQEIDNLADYSKRFPKTLIIQPDTLGQILHYSPGSPFVQKMGMKEIDFYRFDDPRCLLLAALLRHKLETVLKHIPHGSPIFKQADQILSLRIMDFLSRCVAKAKEIPADRFDIEPILDIVRGGGSDRDILEGFYTQLSASEEEDFSSAFENHFADVFPRLASLARSPKGVWEKVLRRLLGMSN